MKGIIQVDSFMTNILLSLGDSGRIMIISIGHTKIMLDISLPHLFGHTCARSTFKLIQEGILIKAIMNETLEEGNQCSLHLRRDIIFLFGAMATQLRKLLCYTTHLHNKI